ncbi:MAG: hypothetical protein LBL26_11600 [Peptococcaceae bacterium]|jgi:hypothetical protein|nr:hypothetical protein [Peptococcaceae bacterium]
MDCIKKNAMDAKQILDDFFREWGINDIKRFRSMIHLRPAADQITIVSTLPGTPMTGMSVKLAQLRDVLPELSGAIFFKNMEDVLDKLKSLGFKKQRMGYTREEKIQSILIHDMVVRPQEYEGIHFVASELDLSGFGGKDGKQRADIIGFKDDVLYDIEIKSEWFMMGTVSQAKGNVDFLRAHLPEYAERLAEFPNFHMGRIRDVQGIAVVPWLASINGSLEKYGAKHEIALWFLEYGYMA